MEDQNTILQLRQIDDPEGPRGVPDADLTHTGPNRGHGFPVLRVETQLQLVQLEARSRPRRLREIPDTREAVPKEDDGFHWQSVSKSIRSRNRSLGPPYRGVPEPKGPDVLGLVDVAQVHQHRGAHQGTDALQVEGAEGVPFGDDDQDVGALGGGVGVGAEVDAGQEVAGLGHARGVEGRRVELQLRHLIREVENLISETFLKNIQVQTIVPHDLWTVVGDPTQFHQVLVNLCVNARDAMPEGGTLTLSAENVTLDEHFAGLDGEAHPGAYVLLQVEDTGTGIPAEVIAQIFDPFFTTKEVGKGTGLGLSTTLTIVKSHGGFIRVESKLGRGSKFSIYLPAESGPGHIGNIMIGQHSPLQVCLG